MHHCGQIVLLRIAKRIPRAPKKTRIHLVANSWRPCRRIVTCPEKMRNNWKHKINFSIIN